VAAMGEKLRELMQRHLRELAQAGLMRELNQAVREELGDVHYATMVAVGWHSRRGFLVMTNAGHPPPLWFRASRQEWSWLQARRTSERERPADTPLGLLDDNTYDRTVVQLRPGDLVVLYSDAPPKRRIRLEMNSVVTDSCASPVVSTRVRPKPSVVSSPQRSVPFGRGESLSTIKRSSC
jgi:hypothetical protein